MKTCDTCRFKSISLTGNKAWKCKQFGNVKRFNIACLHGWFCKYFKENRKKCEYRHENGNCLKVGGFCLSVDDEHCVKGGKE